MHVLSLPPAFVLSQDQTLKLIWSGINVPASTAGTRKAFQIVTGYRFLPQPADRLRKKRFRHEKRLSRHLNCTPCQGRAAKAPPPAFLFPIPHNVKEPENKGNPSPSRHPDPLFTRVLPAKSAPYRRAPMHCQTHLSDNFSPRRQCLCQGRKVPPQACLRRLDAKLSA